MTLVPTPVAIRTPIDVPVTVPVPKQVPVTRTFAVPVQVPVPIQQNLAIPVPTAAKGASAFVRSFNTGILGNRLGLGSFYEDSFDDIY
jgi:hypothetical protein